MGPELLLALGTAAGGAYISNQADKRRAGEQRSILNRSLDRSEKAQAETTGDVLKEAQKYAGDQRMAELQQQEAANVAQAEKDGAIRSAATAAVPGQTQGQPGTIALGDADKALSEGNRMTAIARELAKVRAPNQLLAAAQLRRANLAGDTNNLWSNDRSQANAAGLDAQSVKAPWWGTLGKVAQAVGTGMAGSALGAGLMASGTASAATTGANYGANYGRIFAGG